MTSQASPRALVEQLQLLVADPGSYFEDDAQKREFQKLARQAGAAVEGPFETMQRLVYGVSDCAGAVTPATADPLLASPTRHGTHRTGSWHLQRHYQE